MFVYVQVSDSGRLLKIECDPNDLVSTLNSKVSKELGICQSEENLNLLNYLGTSLDSNFKLKDYNIRESSLLYLGNWSGEAVQSPTSSQNFRTHSYTAKIPLQFNQYHQYNQIYQQQQQMQANNYAKRW
ncbi:hypothetical protein BpHYR1_046563 [Brachionus plicatilis]|uniref:Ubiquitin-like domain-containing protein n=1 Tax=Brachionus plicatilis TaxID=10195 RepID=A0A3M7QM62_BRAPC|nr:hypothetical protein BpHYR1_046563 [Brachionus plicatilis]